MFVVVVISTVVVVVGRTKKTSFPYDQVSKFWNPWLNQAIKLIIAQSHENNYNNNFNIATISRKTANIFQLFNMPNQLNFLVALYVVLHGYSAIYVCAALVFIIHTHSYIYLFSWQKK